MSKFQKLRFSYIPIAPHCHFLTTVNTKITNSPTVVATALGDRLTVFREKLAEEQSALDWVEKSDLTEKIKDADKRQDRALTGLRVVVNGQMFHGSPTIADAATRIYGLLMEPGDITRRPYEDESGYVESIIRQLSTGGMYYNDVQTISLTAPSVTTQITELKNANNLFKQLLEQRDAQSLLKPGKTFKEIRKEIEPVYHDMVTIIDANAVVNTSPGFAALIDLLNPEIDRLNAEHHRVRHDIAHCQPEEIPAQQYTGYPVNPTPKVLYVTANDGTVRLELGKDYDLRYKDNIEVGNALCIIKGIGEYKGSKTVSFIIKRL
ncbi:MAG: DUF6261 family protein [Dysgonamonadaceae bacterium]|jgi:hypothetical protein|nr:DUF6261 family protein [Dysgonamonadaceae bacterium]